MKKTQNQMIREHLEAGHRLTSLEALNLFGCLRLASRVSDLKKQGVNVQKEMVTDRNTGKQYASYYVPREVQEKPFAVYDCYQPVKARELAERGELF